MRIIILASGPVLHNSRLCLLHLHISGAMKCVQGEAISNCGHTRWEWGMMQSMPTVVHYPLDWSHGQCLLFSLISIPVQQCRIIEIKTVVNYGWRGQIMQMQIAEKSREWRSDKWNWQDQLHTFSHLVGMWKMTVHARNGTEKLIEAEYKFISNVSSIHRSPNGYAKFHFWINFRTEPSCPAYRRFR